MHWHTLKSDQVLFVIGTARETDLVMFDVAEKICTIGAVYLMICLILGEKTWHIIGGNLAWKWKIQGSDTFDRNIG